jgi:phospholipid/cholesterol/gamma-HCH transport system substrate-binding protein
MIGNRHQAFTRHVDFYTEFTNLYGLAKGAKVQVAGMDGGQILEVGIPDSPASKFRVRLRIDEKLHGLVRTDSIATIGTEGVVGNTFLSISSGSPQAPAAAAQTTLSSKEPTEIADLLDRAKGTISDIDSTVRNANGVVTTVGTNLNSTLGSVKTAVSNVNDIVVGLKEGQGPAGMLLRDRALEGKIRQTLTNAQEATANLRRASAQVDTLTSDIQSRQFPLKIDETLASAKDAASNFEATSQQVHQTVDEFSGPDAQGITAGINLRESLSNVNAATGNLADDTEALKHNFFFRPFFRHRGYYNLARISPDKYRNDHLFASSDNLRAWLPANELFSRDSRGIDRLTVQGKTLLDGTVSKYGDSIIENPIIVEGYSDDSNPRDRLAVSRDRSIQVRNYIQTHFQLNPANLGAVALEDRPPSGMDRSKWNGVAIVIPRPKP